MKGPPGTTNSRQTRSAPRTVPPDGRKRRRHSHAQQLLHRSLRLSKPVCRRNYHIVLFLSHDEKRESVSNAFSGIRQLLTSPIEPTSACLVRKQVKLTHKTKARAFRAASSCPEGGNSGSGHAVDSAGLARIQCVWASIHSLPNKAAFERRRLDIELPVFPISSPGLPVGNDVTLCGGPGGELAAFRPGFKIGFRFCLG